MFEVLKNNLNKLGYTVSVFETANDATNYVCDNIVGKTVGFGGSVTLEQMGLYDKLSKSNDVRWHHRLLNGKTAKEVRHLANEAEIYISSVNAVAKTGEIVNIDATGNRVASILYGHKKVYLIVGKNKIANTYDDALFRARNIASPKNAQRLGVNTPCAKNADRCYNCSSPERICRGLVVLWEKPLTSDIEVILVNQDLGY